MAAGKLTVITRNAATTYYEGPNGPIGIEYELVKGFAQELGVELELRVAGNLAEVLSSVAESKVDFAAAGLTVTRPRQVWADFATPYHHITQQLIYRLGTPRPASLDELDGHLEILADSSHAEQLRYLKLQHPDLSWVENNEQESEELLTMVWEQIIEYTVADSHEFAMNRRFHPELRAAFDISQPEPLAWAFRKSDDHSLLDAANRYLNGLKENGKLDQLRDRYFGHLQNFDYVGTRIYLRHIQTRLPEYRSLFEDAASTEGLDWQLVAAMAYQESHWDPDAVSPTGVRGLMMLTRATASHMGIDKRTDPAQSIDGGTRYIRKLINKVPERIEDPDRTWLAVAAYNIGFGHLEDARIITQNRGGNPDSWKDVREHLPLLRKKYYYRRTKHGYARGNEAVQYVENIRTYYDILRWTIEKDEPVQEIPAPTPQFESLPSAI